MNSFVVEIFDNEGTKCCFYTVRWLDAIYSETDKFFLKSRREDAPRQAFQELAKFLTKIIGDEDGANPAYFRFENEAHGLPPSRKFKIEQQRVSYIRFPLRLYCLRISDEVVVLFNGDEKTSVAAQDGKTSIVFYEANQFAKRILGALRAAEFEFGQATEIIL